MSTFQPVGKRKEERASLPFKDTSCVLANYTPSFVPLARAVVIWTHLAAEEHGTVFQAAYAQLQFTSAVTEDEGRACDWSLPGTVSGTEWRIVNWNRWTRR